MELSIAVCCGCGENQAEAEGGAARSRPPARVRLAPLRQGALEETHTYLGEVRALARAELAAGAAGEVIDVSVRVGDRVARGDTLLRLDSERARARVAAAEAAHARTVHEQEQATRDAARFRAAGESVAAVEAERAATQALALEAETNSLAASEREARELLARHRVRAPFDGVIAARDVDPGDWVAEGDAVLELVATDRVEVLVGVAPEILPRIRPGHPAILHQGSQRHSAEVVAAVPAAEPASRTAQLRIVATDPSAALLPGTTVDVALGMARDGEGWLIPRDALVTGVATTRVFVIEEGAAKAVPVEVIDRGDDELRVRAEGLTIESRVVIEGNDRLRPGEAVQVADAPPSAS